MVLATGQLTNPASGDVTISNASAIFEQVKTFIEQHFNVHMGMNDQRKPSPFVPVSELNSVQNREDVKCLSDVTKDISRQITKQIHS